MFVEVRAKDITVDRKTESCGGSMWVNDSEFKIALRTGRERHLDDAPWYLELKAASNEQKGAGGCRLREVRHDLRQRAVGHRQGEAGWKNTGHW